MKPVPELTLVSEATISNWQRLGITLVDIDNKLSNESKQKKFNKKYYPHRIFQKPI
jgi:hypothetical protein